VALTLETPRAESVLEGAIMAEWLIALGTIVSVLLLWQQNQILARQGPTAAPRQWTKMLHRYWPLVVMIILVVLNAGFAGVTVYSRQEMQSPASGIPTELHLEFHNGQQPHAVEKRNISHWDALNVEMAAEVRNPAGKLVGTQTKRVWIVFLVFDRPITVGEVRVRRIEGAQLLTSYEVKDRTDRSAVIYFQGDIAQVTLAIEVSS
jgi:hypothetical protein